MTRPDDFATTTQWGAICKDCRSRRAAAERAGTEVAAPRKKRGKHPAQLSREEFDYPDEAAQKTLDRGGSRSDRCPECRRLHRDSIRAFPVPYVDIEAIGMAQGAADEAGPSGPLGGLGPLPEAHKRSSETVNLASFEMGLQPEHSLELLKLLAANQVVILEAGTGTGKSTLAPFRLMNPPAGAAYRPTDFGPIVVTEPRILATTGVARFVGERLCFNHDPKECAKCVGPGYPVGYQCDGERFYDESCQLIYVTDGTMLNWIARGDLGRFSVVVIDEAHERNANIDSILTLLRENMHRYPALRVLIASATIDAEFFIDFFSGAAQGIGHLEVPAIKTVGYGVPLFPDLAFTDEVLESGIEITGVKYSGWSTERMPETDLRNLRDETKTLLGLRASRPPLIDNNWRNRAVQESVEQAFRIMEAVCRGTVPPGDVISFLHGQRQCKDARKKLQEKISDVGLPVDARWLMKETDKSEKEAATSACHP